MFLGTDATQIVILYLGNNNTLFKSIRQTGKMQKSFFFNVKVPELLSSHIFKYVRNNKREMAGTQSST